MCLTQKREIKVSQNVKFSHNREIKVSRNMEPQNSEFKVSRKFHVIWYFPAFDLVIRGKYALIGILCLFRRLRRYVGN